VLASAKRFTISEAVKRATLWFAIQGVQVFCFLETSNSHPEPNRNQTKPRGPSGSRLRRAAACLPSWWWFEAQLN